MPHWRVHAYSLLPDHLHAVVGLRKESFDVGDVVGRFKSLSTRLYWTRGQALFGGAQIQRQTERVERSSGKEAQRVLLALSEWRATLRPEILELRAWPRVTREQFRRKVLWRRSYFDHINRNEDDLRETVEYILLNPVKRGYVTKPFYYPFSGVLRDH